MKQKQTRTPRRNKDKERADSFENQLRYAQQRAEDTDKRNGEQALLRTYRMLEAEHADLLARAKKLDVLMRSMSVKLYDDGSPSCARVVGF